MLTLELTISPPADLPLLTSLLPGSCVMSGAVLAAAEEVETRSCPYGSLQWELSRLSLVIMLGAGKSA